MLKFTIKISAKNNDSCKVDLSSPKKEEFEKASVKEKSCAIVIQQKIMKALEDLENE